MSHPVARVVTLSAIALLLAGCDSLSTHMAGVKTLPIFTFSDGTSGLPVTLESEPPGAEVTLSTGGTCRTPCALPAPITGTVASFSLEGYQPLSVQIKAVPPDPAVEQEFAAANTRLDPNPVHVELQSVAAPAQEHKKPRPTARRTRAPAPKPAPETPAATTPAPAPAPATIAPATPIR